MRDLYNRKQKLEHWIEKAKTTLDEPDRTHVLKFIEFMQEKEKSILWIVRCITALLQVRKQLDKPFVECQKEDIKSLFLWMDSKHYKVSTHEKFRKILKIFYKIAFEKKFMFVNNPSMIKLEIKRTLIEIDLFISIYGIIK